MQTPRLIRSSVNSKFFLSLFFLFSHRVLPPASGLQLPLLKFESLNLEVCDVIKKLEAKNYPILSQETDSLTYVVRRYKISVFRICLLNAIT